MYDINGKPETMAGTEFFYEYIFVPYFRTKTTEKKWGVEYHNSPILL